MDAQLRSDGLYFLKRNPLFSPLGEEVLTELVHALKTNILEKGAVLLREGSPGDGLYLIKTGRVRIVGHSDKGEEKTVAFLGRGDVIGELALLTGEPHTYGIVADTPCELMLLSKTDFDAILENHPLVGIHLSRALSKRLAVSFHPPEDKPKQPQMLTLVNGLAYETSLLLTINLAIALVEQTRRRIILMDMAPRSGDMARALGMNPPVATAAIFHEDDLHNLPTLQKLITTHPSGLEILSLHPAMLREHWLPSLPSLLSLLKDHYDILLIVPPLEKDPLTALMVREADRVLLTVWDQAPDLSAQARSLVQDAADNFSIPVTTIRLQEPERVNTEPADFRVPWTETFHQALRATGSPYLPAAQASPAVLALDRIARSLGKLRVGLAMGSGAAYGYALIGILKAFEREGIPIDMVSGTSMGALLGSFYCAGKSAGQIQDIARTITKRWLVENIFRDLTFPHSGAMAGQTLMSFLRGVLGDIEFHQLLVPFAAVATDIRTGQEVVIKEGRVVDAVRASTSLPILFQPFLYKGHFLVDGGLVNPVPT
ncbi:MAG TPA: patatin-like phospholipase family protein, partial [Elusimicrobiota bacterium]|nr:patatin-like phospholipase family protein [Elusimicrobiota bacterium]